MLSINLKGSVWVTLGAGLLSITSAVAATTCATVSNGQLFEGANFIPNIASQMVIVQCLKTPGTSYNDCQAVQCSDHFNAQSRNQCGTESTAKEFFETHWSAAIAQKWAIQQCLKTPGTSYNDCNQNTDCAIEGAGQHYSCEAASHGNLFRADGFSSKISKASAIARCLQGPGSSYNECTSIVDCKDDFQPRERHECGTSSAGREFFQVNWSLQVANHLAVQACLATPGSTYNECTQNSDCRVENLGPRFACETVSNGRPFPAMGFSAKIARATAIGQCLKIPGSTYNECQNNAGCRMMEEPALPQPPIYHPVPQPPMNPPIYPDPNEPTFPGDHHGGDDHHHGGDDHHGPFPGGDDHHGDHHAFWNCSVRMHHGMSYPGMGRDRDEATREAIRSCSQREPRFECERAPVECFPGH